MPKFCLVSVIILISIIFISFFAYVQNSGYLLFFRISMASSPSLPFPSNSSPPNLCSATTTFFGCIDNLALVVVKMIMFFAIILATIFATWSGILYIIKSADKEEISKIHQRLIWTVVGLIVALTAFVFIRILEKSIFSGIFRLVFVYANIAQPLPPTELKCGNYNLPSIFSSGNLTSGIWQACLWFYLGQVLSLLYRIAMFLAVIFLSWAGILYITQPEKSKEVHGRLIWGIVGALIAILSFTIVKLIEAFFLNVVPSGP